MTVNCQLSTVIKDFSDFWLITALRTVFLRDVAASRHSSNKFGSALGKTLLPSGRDVDFRNVIHITPRWGD